LFTAIKIIADQEGCLIWSALAAGNGDFWSYGWGLWLHAAVQEEMELTGICSGRRVSKGIVDPFPEVTIGKEIPAKQRDKVGKRPPQLGTKLEQF
jgi:hypothetical protein